MLIIECRNLWANMSIAEACTTIVSWQSHPLSKYWRTAKILTMVQEKVQTFLAFSKAYNTEFAIRCHWHDARGLKQKIEKSWVQIPFQWKSFNPSAPWHIPSLSFFVAVANKVRLICNMKSTRGKIILDKALACSEGGLGLILVVSELVSSCNQIILYPLGLRW